MLRSALIPAAPFPFVRVPFLAAQDFTAPSRRAARGPDIVACATSNAYVGVGALRPASPRPINATTAPR